MNLLPLSNRLVQAALGVQGKSLFLEMMPAEAQSAILLRTPLTGTKINHEMPGYYRASFQLIVRTLGYDAGKVLTKQVMGVLTFGELALETQTFVFSRPRTLPVAFPLSKGNLVEHNVMFDCTYVETS